MTLLQSKMESTLTRRANHLHKYNIARFR